MATKKKPSFQEYESGQHKFGDISRAIDPVSWAGEALGFKNPVHDWFADTFKGDAKGHGDIDRVRFGGNVFAGWMNDMSPQDKEALYNSMSPEELTSIGKETNSGQANRLKAKWDEVQKRRATGEDTDWYDPEELAARDADKKEGLRKQRLDAFIAEMNSPLNMADPQVHNVMNRIASLSKSKAAGQGYAGGLSEAATASSLSKATADLTLQRKQLGLQAMQAGMADEAGLRQLKESQYRYDNDLNMQNQQNQFNQGMAGAQSTGSLLGGAFGAYMGYKGGGWQGAQQGMQMGSNIGAGWSGSNYARSNPTPQYNSQRYSGGGRSGGGMSGGY